ncbi:MFS transporter [Amnibacterium sp. CER49]|uniref:MFS transporter n=1 Tax=Amnibacterium sp. CER49 TaxID=3039161 RepID=UPI00244CD56B|nr:MFS transporter [Amnibacterium sp. CER49]MDH2443676.1 MFS transporter [Amnibacterium sp. CER49]
MTISVPPVRRVVAWAAWDWGGAAFNAVITTFVFTVYLTSDLFVDPALPAGSAAFRGAKADLSTRLGLWLAVAGLVVAVLAPVLGQRSDATGRRRRPLAIGTAVVVVAMLAMTLVRPTPSAFLAGVLLVAVGTIAYEVATVHYNAMLPAVSTPRSIGRISAVGWAAGYLGGIVLLLLLYVTLIPQGPQLLHLPQADGLGVRLCALVCAVWAAVFAVPVLLAVPDERPAADLPRRGILSAYRKLGADVAHLWRTDRPLLGFLVASAVFRDGLTGVFTFGAVIASTVFGFGFGQVLIFGVAANVVAGASTLVSGRFDDRFGPKAVIVTALTGLVITGLAVFLARGAGQGAFWICGLLLCVFVGPAQSASRSLLARLAPPQRQGELFGLYATTGRVATFLAPALFAAFTGLAGDQAYGVLGIVAVLAAGLLLLLPIRTRAAVRA